MLSSPASLNNIPSARSRRQPRNRAVVDVVAAGDLAHGFAIFLPPDRLGALMRGEFRLAPHFHSPRLCAFSPLACATADKVAFKLCQPAQHGEHKSPV